MQGSPKKLLSTAHTSRHWRIHVLTNDFRVEDVWSLPTLMAGRTTFLDWWRALSERSSLGAAR